MSDDILILRRSTPRDAGAIARLVELEGAEPLVGDSLVAELDGTVVAAVTLADGRAVADIFRPTAELVRMLRDRREQLIRARRLPASATSPRGVQRLLARQRTGVPA
jgi:hypothetical protein